MVLVILIQKVILLVSDESGPLLIYAGVYSSAVTPEQADIKTYKNIQCGEIRGSNVTGQNVKCLLGTCDETIGFNILS